MTSPSRVSQWIRPHLKTFQAYTSARTEATQTSEEQIFLDANELSLGPALPLPLQSLFGNFKINRYPDPEQRSLREKLAGYWKVPSDRLFIGSGSDEVIDLLIRLFCEPGKDSVLVTEPTYGVYRVAAHLNEIRLVNVELKSDFSLDREGILEAIKEEGPKIVFLCSPNNPTGNLLSEKVILQICDSCSGLVVVDQAYVEFSQSPRALIDESLKRDNLLLMRTFSKAWGLAALRLGYAIAAPEIVGFLLRIKPPYNIGSLPQSLGLAALEEEEKASSQSMSRQTAKIRELKLDLQKKLQNMECVRHVYPSGANFLLVEFDDRDLVYNQLLSQGIVVRRRSESRLRNCLRITVGTLEENEKLLAVLLSEIPKEESK